MTGMEQQAWQYGAVGFIALVCGVAVVKLFGMLAAAHARELLAANERADKAEARAVEAEKGLADLNKQVREQSMGQLVRATDAISRAYELLAEQERGRR